METISPGIENTQLKGVTLKNIIVTVISTASIVATVAFSYSGLKQDIATIIASQETTNRVNDIRIKMLEQQVTLLQMQVKEIQEKGK